MTEKQVLRALERQVERLKARNRALEAALLDIAGDHDVVRNNPTARVLCAKARAVLLKLQREEIASGD